MVVNAGSDELRFYDELGRHLTSVGGEGEGPGEFRRPARVWIHGSDSLRVWDEGSRRTTYFDLDGGFSRTETLAREAPAFDGIDFALDIWVYGLNWIDSPLAPGERGLVAQALGRIPPVDVGERLRYIRLTAGGRLWVSAAVPPVDREEEWTVYELDGTPRATLAMPARFEPHDIGHDYVLGRFKDELDIDHIRSYALEKPPGSPLAVGLSEHLAAGNPPFIRLSDAIPEDDRMTMRTVMRSMAIAQEMNYARNYGYTLDLAQLGELDSAIPDGIRIAIPVASDKGWIGLVLHEDSGGSCVLSFGAPGTIGWPAGGMICL